MGKMKELGLLDCEDRQSIEENFERISKGGGGGDLLETVETEVPLELVFDGNPDNYETVNMEGFVYVKVSDISDLTIEQLNGSTLTMINNGTAMSGILDDRAFTDYAPMGAEMIVSPIDIYSDDGMSSVSTFALLVVYGDTSGMGVSFPTGIWFLFVSDSYYINSLTCPNATTTTTKTQLKPSLLPTHKHKWNDIEDAICGEVEEVLYSAENVEFGDLIGTGIPVHILEESPTITIGETYSIIWNGESFKCEAVNDDIGNVVLGNTLAIDEENTGEPFAYLYDPKEKVIIVMDVAAILAGTTGNTINSFSIAKTVLTPLPPKFMPELTQVILISPGGKKFKTTVDDTGQLVTTEV